MSKLLTGGAVMTRSSASFQGYDVFELQVGEPLLQLGGAAQRAGADHAARRRRRQRHNRFEQVFPPAWTASVDNVDVSTVPFVGQGFQSFPGILGVQDHGIVRGLSSKSQPRD